MKESDRQKDPDRLAGHGLTHRQLEELHYQQKFGKVPMISANIEPRFKIPKVEEESTYFLLMESPLFHEETGKRKDRGKSVKKYSIAAYRQAKKFNQFGEKNVFILHNPEKALEARLRKEGKFQEVQKEKENPNKDFLDSLGGDVVQKVDAEQPKPAVESKDLEHDTGAPTAQASGPEKPQAEKPAEKPAEDKPKETKDIAATATGAASEQPSGFDDDDLDNLVDEVNEDLNNDEKSE